MSTRSINGKCSKNVDYKARPENEGFTENIPPRDFNGSKRHYFAKPLQKFRNPTLTKLNKL